MSNQPTTCTIDEADRKAIVKRRFDVWDMRLYSLGIITFIAVSSLSAASHIGGLKQSMMPYVRPLAVLLGIEQSWQVFAPDPRRMNLHNSAVITFQDGSMKMYEFPRMDLIKGWERFRLGDRQRKLFDEWMSEPRGEPYRSDLARYL